MSEIYGLHAVSAALEQAPERIRVLYVQKGKGGDRRKEALADQARSLGVRVEFVDRGWLDRKAGGAHPVSYTHLTLPTIVRECRSRWSPSH